MGDIIRKTLVKALEKIAQFFDAFSLTMTLLLLFVVAFNILARLLFDLTDGRLNFLIPGAIELSRYTLLFIVFSALPHANVSGSMVRVDLISKHLAPQLQCFFERLWLLLMAGFSLILVWLFSQKTMLTFNRGDASQDLQIPLFYFYGVISLASGATMLSCVFKAFTTINTANEKPLL